MKALRSLTLAELTTQRAICYGVLKPGERQSEGIPLLRVTDIRNNFVDVSDVYLITQELSAEFRRSVLEGGEVLLSIQGTVGRVAICPLELKGANVSRTLAVIAPDQRIDRRYLRYWLLGMQGNFPVGGATRDSLNIGDIRKLVVPVPELIEQQRLVAILDEAFEGLESAAEKVEANLSAGQTLFVGILNSLLGDDKPLWRTASLDELVSNDCSLSYGIVQPGDERDGGLPIVRPVDLTNFALVGLKGLKRIDPQRAAGYRRTMLQGGEALLCVRGSVGVLSRASPSLTGANVTRGIVPVRFDSQLMHQEFGCFVLGSGYVQKQIRDATYGAALTQINIRDLRKIRIPVPSLEEQEAMVGQLREALGHTAFLEAANQSKADSIVDLRKSILRDAFERELS